MNIPSNFARGATLLALAGTLAWFVGCRDVVPSATDGREGTSAVAAAKSPGYLLPEERPDSIALIPPPPAPGTPEFAADVASRGPDADGTTSRQPTNHASSPARASNVTRRASLDEGFMAPV